MKLGIKTATTAVSIALLLLTIAITARVSSGSVAPGGIAGASSSVTSDAGVHSVGSGRGVVRNSTGDDVDSRDAVSHAADGPPATDDRSVDEHRGFAAGDQLELHGLTAWDASDSEPCVYLSFTPISLDDLFGGAPFKRTVLAGEEIEVADVAPELDPSRVTVSVDGRQVRVLSLNWYYAGYGDLTGTDTKYMPVCVMRVERPELNEGDHRVNVLIEDVTTGAIGRSEVVFASGARRERL